MHFDNGTRIGSRCRQLLILPRNSHGLTEKAAFWCVSGSGKTKLGVKHLGRSVHRFGSDVHE